MHSLVKTLQAVPSLATLDEPALLGLVGQSASLFWPAGSQIIVKGSDADALYVVLSGSVRVLDGTDREITVLGAGEFFGEFSLLLGTPHQHDVEAVTDAELLVVLKGSVDALLDANPDLDAHVRTTLGQRLDENARLSSAGP
jgi:CRP-like cAMP-binding protein